MKHEDIKMDKKTVKKAVGMHDKQMHGGKKTDLAGLKKGGSAKMAFGGTARAVGNAMNAVKAAGPTGAPASGMGRRGAPMPTSTTGTTVTSVKPSKIGPKTNDRAPVRPPMPRTAMMKEGGCAKMAKGGGIEKRGKTRGKMC